MRAPVEPGWRADEGGRTESDGAFHPECDAKFKPNRDPALIHKALIAIKNIANEIVER